jgi:hypothetical protein
MTVETKLLLACIVSLGLSSNASAEPEAKPAPAAPAAVEELSDDAILLQMFAARDYCKKNDAAHSAEFDNAVQILTADSVAEAKAFNSKPDTAASIAKRAAEFEQREKDPAFAGSGKSMCENFLKMQ